MSTVEDVERALRTLEGLRRPKQRRPDRHDARALLVPLGLQLLSQGTRGLEEHLERIRSVGEALGAAWYDAVQDELSLAAGEHVQAVAPRFLDLPNYDFAYTLRARERLEARLVAAAELDLEIPAALARSIELADARLAPYLEGPAETIEPS